MSDLRDLYQEVILDHCKSPRNFREISDASCSANGYNPLCGDKIKVFLRTEGDTIEDAAFNGSGCAISMAAASMMTQAARGATRDQIEQKFQTFHALVTGKTDPLWEAPAWQCLPLPASRNRQQQYPRTDRQIRSRYSGRRR